MRTSCSFAILHMRWLCLGVRIHIRVVSFDICWITFGKWPYLHQGKKAFLWKSIFFFKAEPISLFGKSAWTHICGNNPLCPLDMSPYFTFAGLQNSDALVRKHIEHVSYTQPWKKRQEEMLFEKWHVQAENANTLNPTPVLSDTFDGLFNSSACQRGTLKTAHPPQLGHHCEALVCLHLQRVL